jgi:hypothetical protein
MIDKNAEKINRYFTSILLLLLILIGVGIIWIVRSSQKAADTPTIQWGMTPKAVKLRVTAALEQESETTLTYRAPDEVRIVYQFQEKHLVAVQHFSPKYERQETCVQAFQQVLTVLQGQYGDSETRSEQGRQIFWWETPQVMTILSLWPDVNPCVWQLEFQQSRNMEENR